MTISERDDVPSINESMSTLPMRACPACHSQAFRTILIGEHRLKKCKDCGLKYAPAYADPDQVYVEGYFSGQVGNFGLDTRHPNWDAFLDRVAQMQNGYVGKGRQYARANSGCGLWAWAHSCRGQTPRVGSGGC